MQLFQPRTYELAGSMCEILYRHGLKILLLIEFDGA